MTNVTFCGCILTATSFWYSTSSVGNRSPGLLPHSRSIYYRPISEKKKKVPNLETSIYPVYNILNLRVRADCNQLLCVLTANSYCACWLQSVTARADCKQLLFVLAEISYCTCWLQTVTVCADCKQLLCVLTAVSYCVCWLQSVTVCAGCNQLLCVLTAVSYCVCWLQSVTVCADLQ
jgi:hypothetical protein